jgi:acetyl-CoA carboxylase biotin carboxyl carrier protein
VKSPVVGWLRLSDQPNSSVPLVEVGQHVDAGQALAVIEAVQIVHEVKAELAGTILKVLAADGQGVEFGQPLFRLQLDP